MNWVYIIYINIRYLINLLFHYIDIFHLVCYYVLYLLIEEYMGRIECQSLLANIFSQS